MAHMNDNTNGVPSMTGGPEPEAGRSGSLRAAVAALVVGALLVAVVAVIVFNVDDEGDVATRTSTTSMDSPVTTTSEPDPAATASASSPEVQPSAAVVLEPFFAAAVAMDEQLHAAAVAINATGPPWASIAEEVTSRVRAAAPEPVAAAIPAGLTQDLLQSVMLVYSDLSSRRAAMQSFSFAGSFPYSPIDPLTELANGHQAAERFDADLAAARSVAASAPPITVAPSDSRAAAELLLLVQLVNKSNFGCESRGGAVFTRLPVVEWHGSGGGTIAGIDFDATLDLGGHWSVSIIAC
jgi:hypothetical protein